MNVEHNLLLHGLVVEKVRALLQEAQGLIDTGGDPTSPEVEKAIEVVLSEAEMWRDMADMLESSIQCGLDKLWQDTSDGRMN